MPQKPAHASTQRNHVLDSSLLKRVASSIAPQGACDEHQNPPFICEQSLNNVGPCRCPVTRALGDCMCGPFQTDLRPVLEMRREEVLGASDRVTQQWN